MRNVITLVCLFAAPVCATMAGVDPWLAAAGSLWAWIIMPENTEGR